MVKLNFVEFRNDLLYYGFILLIIIIGYLVMPDVTGILTIKEDINLKWNLDTQRRLKTLLLFTNNYTETVI